MTIKIECMDKCVVLVFRSAAKPLADQIGAIIIPIGVGQKVGLRDLENVTPHKRNILQVPTNEKPKKLADKLVDNIKAGKICIVY